MKLKKIVCECGAEMDPKDYPDVASAWDEAEDAELLGLGHCPACDPKAFADETAAWLAAKAEHKRLKTENERLKAETGRLEDRIAKAEAKLKNLGARGKLGPN